MMTGYKSMPAGVRRYSKERPSAAEGTFCSTPASVSFFNRALSTLLEMSSWRWKASKVRMP
ncbi:hypothetical protein ULF88_24310 [Halopseudomonas pachastrellae]|nr:hypothetical protein [Halopseudomonas pachastrellae]